MASHPTQADLAAPQAPLSRTPWTLVLGLWGVGFAIMAAASAFEAFEPLPVWLTRSLVLALAGIALDLALWRASGRWSSAARRTFYLTLGALLAVIAHVALDEAVTPLAYRLFHLAPDPSVMISDSIVRRVIMQLIMETNVLLYLSGHALFLVTCIALRSMIQEREQERRVATARAHAVSAQLATLRHQLNPHFMFNTLNAIGSLVATGRGEQAEEMIERLSAFLRTGVGRDAEPLVTLEDELVLTQTYLDIETVRFGDRLHVRFAVAPELGLAIVPSFLLQPLVENAIKYAVGPAMRPVEVRIRAERDGGLLVIAVEDDGPGTDSPARPPGTGTGLRNIGERLALLYGADASLQAEPAGQGFVARIVMPLRLAEEGVAA